MASKQTKMCVVCHEVKPLEEFYKNRSWHEQRFCDAYCKECAKKMVKDKETVRRYFWDNNRLWSDDVWEMAKKKAAYTLATNEDFLRKNASREKRQAAEDKAIALACLTVMNNVQLYGYSDNVSEDSEEPIEFDPDSDAGTVITSPDGTLSYVNDAKIFSAVWNGKYTKAEIEYMDNYYDGLADTFDITDIAKEDNFRKCAKASLLYDRAQNLYREGKATMQEVRAAQSMYDENLKTANLAACTRKEKTQGVMALGQIIEMIENEGLLQTTKVEFPKDDIDRILEDFSHTAVAIGEIDE